MNWEAQTDDLAWQCEERLRGILKDALAENRELRIQIFQLQIKLRQYTPDPRFPQARVQEAREV